MDLSFAHQNIPPMLAELGINRRDDPKRQKDTDDEISMYVGPDLSGATMAFWHGS